MDPQQLLRRARQQSRLTQRELAALTGVARSSVVAYETGTVSPTVRQLTRLLRACGLQLNSTLEPLDADLDAVLDAALDAPPPAPLDELVRLVPTLTERSVRWAVDGRTALSLQGVGLAHHHPCVALLDDRTSRSWLRAVGAWGHDRDGFRVAPHWEEPPELLETYTRRPLVTMIGQVQVRVVDELPACIPISVEDVIVPVMPLLDVEDGDPELGVLLARLRERRP